MEGCRSSESPGGGRQATGPSGIHQGCDDLCPSGDLSEEIPELPFLEIEPQADDPHRRRLGNGEPEQVEGIAQAGAHGVPQEGHPEVGERRQGPGRK
jgi:hypothetical protein